MPPSASRWEGGRLAGVETENKAGQMGGARDGTVCVGPNSQPKHGMMHQHDPFRCRDVLFLDGANNVVLRTNPACTNHLDRSTLRYKGRECTVICLCSNDSHRIKESTRWVECYSSRRIHCGHIACSSIPMDLVRPISIWRPRFIKARCLYNAKAEDLFPQHTYEEE